MDMLEKIEPRRCREILTDPQRAIQDAAPDLGASVVPNLVLEAIRRYCGSIGANDTMEPMVQEGTRTADPSSRLTEDRSETLRKEAEYHLEVATGIDPYAANDLLRRLLGSGPMPSQ